MRELQQVKCGLGSDFWSVRRTAAAVRYPWDTGKGGKGSTADLPTQLKVKYSRLGPVYCRHATGATPQACGASYGLGVHDESKSDDGTSYAGWKEQRSG